MGLMDILNGMQNGPRGQRQPDTGSGSGGMSKMTMALIALLAYKALKSGGVLGGGQATSARPSGVPNAGSAGGLGDILGGMLGGGGPAKGAAPAGGGFGDILGGMLGGGQAGNARSGGMGDVLGGLIASGAAGSVLSGGLGNIVKELQNSGHGEVAQSWVGTGANQSISPDDLANALGADSINAVSQQTGLSRNELLQGLSQQLPDFVDQLTPDGRLPTEQEAARLI